VILRIYITRRPLAGLVFAVKKTHHLCQVTFPVVERLSQWDAGKDYDRRE
jgi:hypothetical protein